MQEEIFGQRYYKQVAKTKWKPSREQQSLYWVKQRSELCAVETVRNL